MSRTYESPQQAIYDTLIEIRAQTRGTNERLDQIVELLQHLAEAGREHTGNE